MTARTANPRILPQIVERWSPRSFDGAPIPEADLAVILEAAALAPSAFNYQPWRFLYAINGDDHWDAFLAILFPFNAEWAKNAGALIFVASDKLMRLPKGTNPSHSHSFDAGAAWAMLALQATTLGYHSHGMTGIDFAKGPGALGLPDDFRLEAAIAIGKKDSPDRLPANLAEREAPSGRHSLKSLAVRGIFNDLTTE